LLQIQLQSVFRLKFWSRNVLQCIPCLTDMQKDIDIDFRLIEVRKGICQPLICKTRAKIESKYGFIWIPETTRLFCWTAVVNCKDCGCTGTTALDAPWRLWVVWDNNALQWWSWAVDEMCQALLIAVTWKSPEKA